MKSSQFRKFLLTIQNSAARGYSHETIRDILGSLNVDYACMSDEIATTGTPHTHVFFYRKGAIREDTIRRKFPGVHFDNCYGSCQENRAYVAKEGKWAETEKAETSVPGTFEEFGELPTEREECAPHNSDLIAAIEAGQSTAEIIRNRPKYVFRSNDIDTLRQTLTTERFMKENRDLNVTYIFGPTGVGKTRGIYAAHPAAEICRITNYGTPSNGIKFDAYHGHPVMVFEEFHSQISLPDMLNFLDIYPLMLPARYSDRVACYTTVYLTSNIPLSAQYYGERHSSPATWAAFVRRIHRVIEYLEDGTTIEHDPSEYL